MGELLHQQVIRHLDRTEFRRFAHIIPGQVHQHIVLAELFGILKQVLLQGLVLSLRTAPFPGPGNGHGGNGPALDLNQGFRRRTRQFHFPGAEQHHVLGRIGGPENPVHRKQILVVVCGKPLGVYRLENIAAADMFLDGFHIAPVGFLALVAGNGSQHRFLKLGRYHRLPGQGFQLVQFCLCFLVIICQVVSFNGYC